MDGFTYTNIFETKGMEYLVVIGFLILLIPFWILLNKPEKLKRTVQHALGILSAGILRIPQGIYFSKNHTWTHLNKSGTASIGVDDLLVHITGSMKFKNLKNEGETVNKGERLAEFEQQGKRLTIFSPVSGKIVHVNKELSSDAGLITDDPYGKGWLFLVKPENWKAETADCYVAGETTGWINNELMRFKDFLAGSVQKHTPDDNRLVLQDGGELCDQTLSALPDPVWQDFQKEFLNPETYV